MGGGPYACLLASACFCSRFHFGSVFLFFVFQCFRRFGGLCASLFSKCWLLVFAVNGYSV